MARISTYIQDTDLQGTDKVIGTDSTGAKTRNFSLTSIGRFLNKSGVLAVARQVLFNFQEDVTTRVRGSVSYETGGLGTMQSTTELILSKLTASSVAVDQLLTYGIGKNVVIFNPYKLNEFSEYRVLDVTEWDQDASFMKIRLSHVAGYGSFLDGETFGFAFFKDAADVHYEHVQSTSSAVWTINHELNKKPAITVVDSADTEVVGELQYIDLNTAQITFNAAFKGKAYCN
jgi:hypothetical protein